MDPTPRRSLCPHCQRPQPTCLCAAVQPVAHQVQVLILMHPHEARQAKGTARLAQLCLQRCRLQPGETWPPHELAQLLCAPWDDADRLQHRRTLLLYPATPADAQHPMLAAPPLPAHWLAAPQRLRLVVLDGTWRKSRKMLWCNPALQRLPRLGLEPLQPPRYAMRKAHAPHQRSTLEALQQALQQLEPNNPALPALGVAMNAFVAQFLAQQQARGGMGRGRPPSAMLAPAPTTTPQETPCPHATPRPT